MCLALVPAASNCELTPGSAVREKRGWEVVLVSTREAVVRSHVRTVWSWEAEYATVESFGLKITAWTGAVCAERSCKGPFCGVEVDVVTFRRLLFRPAPGRRDSGAAGAEESVVHIPTFSSFAAESILLLETAI
jgi:hypothetical protein